MVLTNGGEDCKHSPSLIRQSRKTAGVCIEVWGGAGCPDKKSWMRMPVWVDRQLLHVCWLTLSIMKQLHFWLSYYVTLSSFHALCFKTQNVYCCFTVGLKVFKSWFLSPMYQIDKGLQSGILVNLVIFV